MNCCRFFCSLLALFFVGDCREPVVVRAQEQEHDNVKRESEEPVSSSEQASSGTFRWNIPIKTAGGTQLWTDHLHRGGYRLQQNALTEHWRLLDRSDIRRAWGSRRQCESVLDQLRPRPNSEQDPRHVVVLLHGLMRTHHSMKPLENEFDQRGFPDSIRFAYASTRSSIGSHARALREVLEDYPQQTTFSFVGHSMGNIVIRHLLGDLERDGDPQGLLPRFRSMVMLGPPNQGSAIARRLAPTGLYGFLTGKGGLELGPEWKSFAENLATPDFPFAIIAGDISEKPIQNPLVAGSGDFVVTVEETELAGNQWLKTVPVVHSFLMSDPATMTLTVDFIKAH